MAANKVYTIQVSSKGLAELVKLAKEANVELNALEKPRTIKQAQSRVPLSADQRMKTSASTKERQELRDYAKVRGTLGTTGAEGRDFGRQAQGLGGLVHLYATFAANLFAVTAAFTALKKAADFQYMISSSEQLGTTMGVNMSAIAKDMVKVTDGAVGLKEALSGAALASSAGLSADQIGRLTRVAKTASQVLGRDVTDSLNRLTRGITKVEPELLDELGIMVKVNEANLNYARSVGKTVTSLTDYERRQAFANAVIEQGEKKFKAIAAIANPFDKFTASLQNMALEGGGVIAKVLNPILEILSSSPTALAGVIATVISLLLKKALPEIGNLKSRLLTEAEDTQKKLQGKLEVLRQQQYPKLIEEEKRLAKDISTIRGSIDLKASGLRTKKIENLTLDKAEERRKKLRLEQAEILREQRRLKKEEGKDLTGNEKRSLELKRLQNIELDKTIAKLKQIDVLEKSRNKLIETKESSIPPEFLKEQRKAALRTARLQAGAYGADLASVTNPFEAFSLAKGRYGQALDEVGGKVSKLTKGYGLLSIGLSTFSNFALKAVSSFSIWTTLITIGVGIFNSLTDAIGLSIDSQKVFGESLDELSNQTEFLGKTIEKALIDNTMGTVQGFSALSTASNDLSDRIKNVATSFVEFNKVLQTAPLSRFYEWLKGIVGFSQTRTIINNITDAIEKQFLALKEAPILFNKFSKDLSSYLGIPIESAEDLNKALKNIEDRNVLEKVLLNISKATTKASREFKTLGDTLVGIKKELEDFNKELSDTYNSLLPNDKISKLGAAAEKVVTSIKGIINNPNLKDSGAISDLLTSFSSDRALLFAAAYNGQLEETSKISLKIIELNNQRIKAQEKLNDLKSKEIKLNEDVRRTTPESIRDFGIDALSQPSNFEQEESANQKLQQYTEEYKDAANTQVSVIQNITEKVKVLSDQLVKQVAATSKALLDLGTRFKLEKAELEQLRKSTSFEGGLKTSRTFNAFIDDKLIKSQIAEIEATKRIIIAQSEAEKAQLELTTKQVQLQQESLDLEKISTLALLTLAKDKGSDTINKPIFEAGSQVLASQLDPKTAEAAKKANEEAARATKEVNEQAINSIRNAAIKNASVQQKILGLGLNSENSLKAKKLLDESEKAIRNLELEQQKLNKTQEFELAIRRESGVLTEDSLAKLQQNINTSNVLNDIKKKTLILERDLNVAQLERSQAVIEAEKSSGQQQKQLKERIKDLDTYIAEKIKEKTQLQTEATRQTELESVALEKIAKETKSRIEDLEISKSSTRLEILEKQKEILGSQYQYKLLQLEAIEKSTQTEANINKLTSERAELERKLAYAKLNALNTEEINKQIELNKLKVLKERISLEAELIKLRKQSLNILAMEADRQGDYTKAAEYAIENLYYKFDEFRKNQRHQLVGLFEDTIDVLHSTIDKVFDQIAEGGIRSLNFKDIIKDMFKEMNKAALQRSADIVKGWLNTTLEGVFTGLGFPKPQKLITTQEEFWQESVNLLGTIATNTELLNSGGLKSGLKSGILEGDQPVLTRSDTDTIIFDIGKMIGEKLRTGFEWFKENIGPILSGLGKELRSAFDFLLSSLSTQTGPSAPGGNSSDGIFGTLLKTGVKAAVNYFTGGIGGTAMDATSSLSSNFGVFSNGGIMSSNGSLPLRRYQTGGVADRPQLALFGEGSMNEAYVPLPDGKRIPVKDERKEQRPVNVTNNFTIQGNTTKETQLQIASRVGSTLKQAMYRNNVR